jgi:methylenetetrahydrofolate dehydrogenase (NADP+)/methenyltetrahydrofolate cyclohydrolase
MGEIVYGSELAASLKEEMRLEVEGLKAQGKRVPCLAVILAGNNPASLSYIKGKEKACAQVGIESRFYHLEENISQAELEKVIAQCSQDPAVDGILVQLPLPQGLDSEKAIAAMDPGKDVDGLHPVNVARLYSRQPGFVPCTPKGIMALLARMGCAPDGRRAVVIGRSALVGTPVARLLLNANATVTMCHSHTQDLAAVAREADILVAAIGRPRLITADYVKEGAYVIDVGINRMEDGHLCGDVDFEAVKDKAAAITPVPKGVGPMTIAMLLENTMQAYREHEAHE